ncbi:DUF4389 domain-containing protein [Ramlibacter sp.]|uniref:DUF4389 domain-containing protein n=1 Tax=Ramlibacter sp. TaxID=1917967 RepID=UPI002C779A68|nr:DUF4389 domain-containing protein [Ramlibacter sp.]HWI81294.1 DUF4389 domain-containing protein [Ramlibacter sp.]
MNDTTSLPGTPPRKLWLRALQMVLMCVAFQIAAWVLVVTALVQLVVAAATGGPHERLRAFGAALGRYLGQIAGFVSFGSDQLPFPFSDWPAAAP